MQAKLNNILRFEISVPYRATGCFGGGTKNVLLREREREREKSQEIEWNNRKTGIDRQKHE